MVQSLRMNCLISQEWICSHLFNNLKIMKNFLYSICLSFLTILTITGCDDWTESNLKSNLRTVHASFENGMTRVGIEQAHDSRDMITKWQENDKIHVIISKGNDIVDIGSVPVHDISPDGKSCVFQYALPDGFDPYGEGYNLLCFTENCNPKIKDVDIFYNASLPRMPIRQFKAPMMFDAYVKEDNSFGVFRHFGTYELMHVTNNTDKDISFQLSDFNVSTWWYKKGGLSIRQWDNSYVTDLSYEEKPLSPSVTIPAHGTDMVVSWYIPNGKTIENAQIVANIDGQYVYSSNTISSKVTLCTGIAYHMYATWDGKELRFGKGDIHEQKVIKVEPTEIDFGKVAVGTTKTEHFTVSNVGNLELTFKVSEQHKEIDIPESGKEFTLAPGKNKTFDVTYTPTNPHGGNGAAVRVFSDAENGTQNVRISGQGVEGTPQAYNTCPDSNHPHLIDLGLPSGTKWACCNVGADAPESYGSYYAWGETKEKDVYNWSTYIHCDGTMETCHDLGSDIAGTKYDVAHVQWGGSWVLPSKEQLYELWNNCTSEWTTLNGVNGRRFTGSNSGTIFLPAAGHRWDSILFEAGIIGFYWSSTQSPSYSDGAYLLEFVKGGERWDDYIYDDYDNRDDGVTVRPVSK